jgi:hypothetical protein
MPQFDRALPCIHSHMTVSWAMTRRCRHEDADDVGTIYTR